MKEKGNSLVEIQEKQMSDLLKKLVTSQENLMAAMERYRKLSLSPGYVKQQAVYLEYLDKLLENPSLTLDEEKKLKMRKKQTQN